MIKTSSSIFKLLKSNYWSTKSNYRSSIDFLPPELSDLLSFQRHHNVKIVVNMQLGMVFFRKSIHRKKIINVNLPIKLNDFFLIDLNWVKISIFLLFNVKPLSGMFIYQFLIKIILFKKITDGHSYFSRVERNNFSHFCRPILASKWLRKAALLY